jgi:hypothetical protein
MVSCGVSRWFILSSGCGGRDRELAQEMTNGSIIFLGGFESALAVCEGQNPLQITCLLETRDGNSEFENRNGRRHVMAPPLGVQHLKLPATRMSKYVQVAVIRNAYLPVFASLGVPGTRMLIHCKNGRHRSAQVTAAIMFGMLGGDPQHVLNYICLRRSAVQFHALPGPRPRASQ